MAQSRPVGADRGSGVRLQDSDHGYAKLVQTLKAWGEPRISVGIHDADAGKADRRGVTVLEKAIFNEFGTAEIPARSFIRAWVDESQGAIVKALASQARLVVAGKISKEQAIERVGLWAVGQIQARIAQGIDPPNAPSTIARKGSSTPLIDTGQLRSSVSYKVDT